MIDTRVQCPYCPGVMECEHVHNGVGWQQSTPYECGKCGALAFAAFEPEDARHADADEKEHQVWKGMSTVPVVRDCELGPSAVASAGGYIPRRLKDLVILGPDMSGDDVGGDP